MATPFFLILLAVSLLFVVLSVLGVWSLRTSLGTRWRRTPDPQGAERTRSSVLTSPVWNVVGVLAGVVGTIVPIIGLLK
ncbi:hypothetical protein [Nocardia sp. NPDC050175]|uniref:hypothetical protein n=1 Tax=Nocardia sp. NPDC050175 TaxID=3364317 RepID=UPI0037923FF9